MNTIKRGFASDNNAGVSPEVIKKLAEVNQGHTIGYGDDIYTRQAIKLLQSEFGENSFPYLVFTGTGANVLSLASVVKGFNSIVCATTAHIFEDECGAPERFTSCKLIPVDTPDGKLTPGLISKHLRGFGFEHHSQPSVISISQPTEMGTVYTVEEIKAIAALAHANNMYLHIDGARLANAAVALKLPFRAFTADAGADVVSFGGTKNGLMAAESVIIYRKDLNDAFVYKRKQAMQLASKMRFIAAQFLAYFDDNLWKKNAIHANEMARLLSEKIKSIPGVILTQKVEANGVFVKIPHQIIEPLKKEFFFYTWNEETGEVRWMTSFDTTVADIDIFVEKLKMLLNSL